MKKAYRKIFCLFAGVLLTAGISSCVYDDDSNAGGESANSKFTLNIHTSSIGQTRAATTITDGTAVTTKTADEKKIQNLTVAIFDNDNSGANLKGLLYEPDDNALASNYSLQGVFSNVMEGGDSVMVAINLPASMTATYKDYTKANFVGTALTIDDALCPDDGSTVKPDFLPMFGKTASQSESDGSFSATVNVQHMVAKVTLKSLSVNFAGTAHTTATFTPTQVFLVNVPDQLDFQTNADDTYQFAKQGAIVNYYQGESQAVEDIAEDGTATYDVKKVPAAQRKYKDYLSTKTFNSTDGDLEVLENTDALTNQYTLYTMPNKNKGTGATDSITTRLIIKGEYRNDGTDATLHTAYYAIKLGEYSATAPTYEVKPNYHYIVTAVIRGDGADNAWDAIPDAQSLQVNVIAGDWEEHKTLATVDDSGVKYSGDVYDGITVGSIMYADGLWTPTYDAGFAERHGAPIAIVFSTSTSDYDKDQGYTHGYAMALQHYNSASARLSTNYAASLQNVQVTDVLISTLEAAKADKDGLKHCRTAYAYCDEHSIARTALTSIYAATDGYNAIVAAPTDRTSEWYLPSMGQIYSVLQATDPTTYTGSESWTNASNANEYSWTRGSNAGTTAANKISSWLAGQGLTATTHYTTDWLNLSWQSSTEARTNWTFDMDLNATTLYFDTDEKQTGNSVHSVLAF